MPGPSWASPDPQAHSRIDGALNARIEALRTWEWRGATRIVRLLEADPEGVALLEGRAAQERTGALEVANGLRRHAGPLAESRRPSRAMVGRQAARLSLASWESRARPRFARTMSGSRGSRGRTSYRSRLGQGAFFWILICLMVRLPVSVRPPSRACSSPERDVAPGPRPSSARAASPSRPTPAGNAGR